MTKKPESAGDSFADRFAAEPVEIDAVVQDCGVRAWNLAEEVFRQFDVPDHSIFSFCPDLGRTLEQYAFRRLLAKLLDPQKADIKKFEKMTAEATRNIEMKLNVFAKARDADPDFVQGRIKYLLGEMDKIIDPIKIPAGTRVKE